MIVIQGWRAVRLPLAIIFHAVSVKKLLTCSGGSKQQRAVEPAHSKQRRYINRALLQMKLVIDFISRAT